MAEVDPVLMIETLSKLRHSVMRELENKVEQFDRDISKILPLCATEQLLKYAEGCGAEVGPEHCWRCEAWDLYIERDDS